MSHIDIICEQGSESWFRERAGAITGSIWLKMKLMLMKMIF